MTGQHRWIIGLATSTGLLGLTVTSGLALLAHHFVDELSHPHVELDTSQFTWEMPRCGAEPPAELRRALTFQTFDGTFVRGEFWAQSQPAPTIILCHGYRLTRVDMYPVAALEYQHGYNILLFDFRGHGESESVITSGGIAEVRDLEAALIVARHQPETLPGKMIIHGFSMGASIALLTPPHPDVAAIIADSAYARLDDVLRRFVHYRLTTGSAGWKPALHQLRRAFPAIAWAIVLTSSLDFRLRFGHPLFARPDRSFKRKRQPDQNFHQSPILLIHGEADETVPIRHAHSLAQAAKASNTSIDVYYVPEAAHCEAYGRNPDRYICLLQQFVSHNLDR